MNSILPLLIFLFFYNISLTGQVNYTANEIVPEYNEIFRPGINPGNYLSWTDEQIAELAAGNPYRSIPGIGAKSIRPSLPEHFLDVFGYEVRLGAFQYYEELGLKENVCFIGYPNLSHRDQTQYCPTGSISQLFSNMYLPVWDDGLDGTPYNDENYLAAYTYQVVSKYKDYVRFWEIWNEPSLDLSNYRANLPKGHPESWWDNDPDPCDMQIQAPVYHYIRMLRVCYDVIKTVDPEAFVTLGGVGYLSFFDVLCRNTDNPVDGSITDEYPLTGGAYFDAVGIHTYPHFDGSTYFIDNGELVYQRHSDAAADGIVLAKNNRQAVLENYGYDGNNFPKKKYIITEINVPRISFDNFMGSAEAQKNFITKALVTAMSNGIHQLHFYNLGDLEEEQNADTWFDVMGFYGNLSNTPPFNQEVNEAGIAFKTASDFLFKTEWDSVRSAHLALPPNIRGGALKNAEGAYVYVLWAKTEIDNSEEAFAEYSFPIELDISNVYKKTWDYSETLFEENISSQNILLNSTPAFFTEAPTPVDETDLDISDCIETADGFNYIGQFLGNKYFKSTQPLTWEDAKIYCEERGGHLVEINGYAENQFLKDVLAEPVFIGLSDSYTEGSLTWANGEPLTFNNIDICNFCSPNDEQNDYLMMHSWDGKWSYNNQYVAKNFIMEIDCFDYTPNNGTGNPTADCDAPVPGYSFIGEFAEKQYYISNGANNWNDSRILAEAQGGNLVIINNAAENNFIRSKIDELVHIGLTDGEQEGTLKWIDGSNPDYLNLDICGFCSGNDENHNNAIMHPWNGGWSFATGIQNFRSIMERKCDDDSGCSTNMALNATATQSSTQFTAGADLAIDGNTDGDFWNGKSASLTNWEFQPWLEIDLGVSQNIDNIEIWNRDDCCEDLFSNYYLLVSNNPFTGLSLNEILDDPEVTKFYFENPAERPTVQEINQSGRYVRVQLTGTSFLVISEIKIFGCPIAPLQDYTSSPLLDFRAHKKGQNSDLNWLILQDEDINKYELEISDGQNAFSLLQTIESDGVAAPRNYQFTHHQPSKGDNFYRLKVIKSDNSFYYSTPRLVTFDSRIEQVHLFPNPTSDLIFVDLSEFSEKKGIVEIYNHFGQKMESQKFDSFGLEPVAFDVKNYSGGIYSMAVKVEGVALITKKFIVSKL